MKIWKNKITKAQRAVLNVLLFAACLFVGNRIFNHVSAWLGVAVIVITLAAAIYLLYKYIRKTYEKND